MGIKDTREQSSGTGGRFRNDTEEALYWHMVLTGFSDMIPKHDNRDPKLTIRQLLSEGYEPDVIEKAISSIAYKANRKDNPIKDPLGYLVVKVGRDENGWSYDEAMRYYDNIP